MSPPDQHRARQRQLRKNSLRRFLAGVPRHSGAILPSVPDDRYQSLLSFYRFCGQQTQDRSVLDLSCGTGFGCFELRSAGASRVVGLEQHGWAVRHAARRYRDPELSFRQATLAELPSDLGRFQGAVGFHVLPGFLDVEQRLTELCEHLEDDAVLVTSVPVIKDEEELLRVREQAAGGPGGLVSHFYPWYWAGILDGFFREVSCFRHLPPTGHAPDYESPFPSRLDPDAFEFEPVQPHDLRLGVNLGAIFVAHGTRARSSGA